MATPDELKSQINSVKDLQSVVKTMKALAAVSIRQYERSVDALHDYSRTVELGLQILLRHRYFSDEYNSLPLTSRDVSNPRIGTVVFGSDQGLCGQFNQQIVAHVARVLDPLQQAVSEGAMAAAGARVVAGLEQEGFAISETFSMPRSVTEITTLVQDVLLTIEAWREQKLIQRILLFYNHPTSGASFQSRTLQLLPLDADWLHSLQQGPWGTTVLPTFTMDWQPLFSALVQEYLFVSLYQAFAASLASENASRLSAMQSAERNIGDRLNELNAEYRRQRQSSITAELLDVVAGFEALS
jgi:F-type H+-transporting ATPase subunit gamma